MFLSKLQLDPRSPTATRDLTNAHAMHQRVMSGFEDGQYESARRQHQVLFRLERTRDGRPIVIIQSQARPNWTKLPENYLLPGTTPETRSLDDLLASIRPGGRYRFRLAANPTKRLRTHTSTPGKRVELKDMTDLFEWFSRRALRAGFEPGVDSDFSLDPATSGTSWENAVRVVQQERVYGVREGTRVTFGGATFEGILKVSQLEPFLSALREGIGSGKAYGFGLLSIAPL
jgi:CRISPR system Cascade subunit CasE